MIDLGCYPLHWLRSFMGEEPEILSAQAELTPLDIDQRMEVKMRFAGGVEAQLVADIASPPFRGLLRVEGEKGVIELDNPCLPHKGHSIREWFGDSYREFTLAAGTTYDYQLAAFLDAVENGTSLPTGGRDAIGNMKALDSIYLSSGLRATSPG